MENICAAMVLFVLVFGGFIGWILKSFFAKKSHILVVRKENEENEVN